MGTCYCSTRNKAYMVIGRVPLTGTSEAQNVRLSNIFTISVFLMNKNINEYWKQFGVVGIWGYPEHAIYLASVD